MRATLFHLERTHGSAEDERSPGEAPDTRAGVGSGSLVTALISFALSRPRKAGVQVELAYHAFPRACLVAPGSIPRGDRYRASAALGQSESDGARAWI